MQLTLQPLILMNYLIFLYPVIVPPSEVFAAISVMPEGGGSKGVDLTPTTGDT